MKLDLIDGRFDLADGEEVLEFGDRPVGDSDGFGFAFGVDLVKGEGREKRRTKGE